VAVAPIYDAAVWVQHNGVKQTVCCYVGFQFRKLRIIHQGEYLANLVVFAVMLSLKPAH
jgi:hypothetical protein